MGVKKWVCAVVQSFDVLNEGEEADEGEAGDDKEGNHRRSRKITWPLNVRTRTTGEG